MPKELQQIDVPKKGKWSMSNTFTQGRNRSLKKFIYYYMDLALDGMVKKIYPR